jgi:hypothetical protein
MRYFLFVIGITAIFTIFTTVFAASAKPNEVRLLPKWAWVLLCVAVPIIGGVLYITIGRPLSNGPSARSSRRVVAPDDDPDFLRNLRDRFATEQPNPESEPKAGEPGPDPDEEPDNGKPRGGDLPNV